MSLDVSETFASVFDAVAPYLADPTILMSLIIVAAIFASLTGKLSWRYTGLILIIGAIYSKLAEIFGPEAAATIIVSNVVSFTVGQIIQAFRQKFIYQPFKQAFQDER